MNAAGPPGPERPARHPWTPVIRSAGVRTRTRTRSWVERQSVQRSRSFNALARHRGSRAHSGPLVGSRTRHGGPRRTHGTGTRHANSRRGTQRRRRASARGAGPWKVRQSIHRLNYELHRNAVVKVSAPQSTESTHGPTHSRLNRSRLSHISTLRAQRGTPGTLSAAPTGPRACAHTRPLTHARFSSQCMHNHS